MDLAAVSDPEGLDATLGFELIELDAETARARIAVRDHIKQRWGFLHGGVHACVAGTLAFEATTLALSDPTTMAIGLSNDTTFLRPIRSGFIHAVGHLRHKGRTTWIWDVDLFGDDDKLCAVSRVRLALRPAPVV